MMDDKDIKEMANKHLDTPEVPRDRMWERIDATRSERRGVLQPDFTPERRPVWRVARLAAGMAAVLVPSRSNCSYRSCRVGPGTGSQTTCTDIQPRSSK